MILWYHKKSLKWWQIINCDWGYRHESGNWSPAVQSDTINEVSPASYETNFDLSVVRTFFMSKEALVLSVLYQLSDISSKSVHKHILCKYRMQTMLIHTFYIALQLFSSLYKMFLFNCCRRLYKDTQRTFHGFTTHKSGKL